MRSLSGEAPFRSTGLFHESRHLGQRNLGLGHVRNGVAREPGRGPQRPNALQDERLREPSRFVSPRARARRCCCRTSPKRSPAIMRKATSSCFLIDERPEELTDMQRRRGLTSPAFGIDFARDQGFEPLRAEPPAPAAQRRAAEIKLVAKNLLAAEILKIRVLEPAFTKRSVGERVHMLEDEQARHEAGRQRGCPAPGLYISASLRWIEGQSIRCESRTSGWPLWMIWSRAGRKSSF